MPAYSSRFLRDLPSRLSSLKITVVCLQILFVLTARGTVYQAEHGLYAAQVRFFHSWIFWTGYMPLPGAQLILWILFFNLTASLLFRTAWTARNIGNILTHGGLLFLLAGTWVTYQYAVESYLPLAEKEISNASLDRRQWEIAAWRKTFEEDDRAVSAVDVSPADIGKPLDFGEFGFKAIVVRYNRNSDAELGPGDPEAIANAEGINRLLPMRPRKDPEDNFPSAVLRIVTEDGEARETMLFGAQRKPNVFKTSDGTVEITLRRKHWPLPFAIKLLDVRKDEHPGTGIARSYESDVEVLTGDVSRPARIYMNHPLRYRGYTLFQSNYSVDERGAESSIFAVVENRGRFIPYISSFMIFGGMVIHFMLMLFGVGGRTVREDAP
jgi:hypothetical protein